MLSNVQRRKEAVEQRRETRRVSFDYDDGEVVLVALCEEVGPQFEDFIESLDLEIRSGPQWVGVGVEVVIA